MLKTVRRAFQIEDIRKRIFYTFMMLIVVRLGSLLPTPGVDPSLTTTVSYTHLDVYKRQEQRTPWLTSRSEKVCRSAARLL